MNVDMFQMFRVYRAMFGNEASHGWPVNKLQWKHLSVAVSNGSYGRPSMPAEEKVLQPHVLIWTHVTSTCYPSIFAQHHGAKPGESFQLWSYFPGSKANQFDPIGKPKKRRGHKLPHAKNAKIIKSKCHQQNVKRKVESSRGCTPKNGGPHSA